MHALLDGARTALCTARKSAGAADVTTCVIQPWLEGPSRTHDSLLMLLGLGVEAAALMEKLERLVGVAWEIYPDCACCCVCASARLPARSDRDAPSGCAVCGSNTAASLAAGVRDIAHGVSDAQIREMLDRLVGALGGKRVGWARCSALVIVTTACARVLGQTSRCASACKK